MTMKKIDEKQNKIIVDLYVKMYYYQIYQTGSIRRNTQKTFRLKKSLLLTVISNGFDITQIIQIDDNLGGKGCHGLIQALIGVWNCL